MPNCVSLSTLVITYYVAPEQSHCVFASDTRPRKRHVRCPGLGIALLYFDVYYVCLVSIPFHSRLVLSFPICLSCLLCHCRQFPLFPAEIIIVHLHSLTTHITT